MKLFKPYISWRARWYVMKTLMGTQIAEGPLVKQFEEEFATYFNLPRAAALNSGTAALEIAFDLAGIGPEDEVIVPILSHPASCLGVVRRGGRVVFADIADDLNVDIADVKKRITPKTKAIVFVHFGGNNRGLKEILELGVPVIEDAAQAVGSPYWGKAEWTAVSLQAIKTLTTGDGGFLICKKPEDHERAKRLRWFGYDRAEKQKKGDSDIVEAGYKLQMNDIAAAIGLGNLHSLNGALAGRERARRAYEKTSLPIAVHAWLAILLHPRALEIGEHLKAKGVPGGQHHYRMDKYSIFGGMRSDLPNMTRLEKSYFFLPYHQDISASDVEKVAMIIREELGAISSYA